MPKIHPDLPFATRIRSRYLPREMTHPPVLDHSAPKYSVRPFHALLINPFYAKDPWNSFGKHVLTPTLALTTVAAATPEHWSVEYFDENLLQGRPPFNPVPHVVGITVHLTFARRAFELARWYRERGSVVVMGGLHVLSCPEEVAPHADVMVDGDGVQVWPKILQDVEEGRLKPHYIGTYDRPYRLDPPALRKILPKYGFLTTSSIIATRGCHNRCEFCYLSTNGLKMPYRMRDAEQVAQEIQDNGEPYAVFIDNNLGSRKDYLYQLCAALRPINIIWSAALTLDITDDPRLIREMALSGCTGVFIGFESLSNENIQEAKKRSPRSEDYARRVAIFHDNGIQVNGSFVLGFDHDRKDVFGTTASWIEENRLESATFHILTPYPGTPLFHQMERDGRLLHKDWTLYDTGHVVFRPKHLSPEELLHGYHWIYQHLFSLPSIWNRRPRVVRAIPPYLAGAILYKRGNRLWHFIIKHRLTHTVWRPLVEWSRLAHLGFRKQLAQLPMNAIGSQPIRSSQAISAGV